MKTGGPVTLKDIARECGISTAAVSMALRNHPRISKTTAVRVKRVADKLGWKPNPLISRLMTQLKRHRSNTYHENVALITYYPDAKARHEIFIQQMCTAMVQRANDLGYKVDEFSVADPAMGNERLLDILNARGIRGCLIAPFVGGAEKDLSLLIKHTACVAASMRLMEPEIDCVIPDHYYNMCITIREILTRGYTRIGLVVERENVERNHFRWLGAYHATLLQAGIREEFVHSPDRLHAAGFKAWFRSCRPEVLISSLPQVWRLLDEMNIKPPRDMGFVGTSVGQGQYQAPVSGIDERPTVIGALAVDVLVGRLNRNESGIPTTPQILMVDGHWVGRGTLRRAKLAPA